LVKVALILNKKDFMAKNKNKGFTLIELLVVIAIIAILAGVVVASTGNARAKARDAKRVSDLDAIASALGMYYSSNSAYPTGLSALAPNYLSTLPIDPNNTGTACTYSAQAAATANCYGYEVKTLNNVPIFCVEALTEGTVSGGAVPAAGAGYTLVSCSTANHFCVCR